MKHRSIIYRAWDGNEFVYMVYGDGNGIWECSSFECIEQYTGIKDRNNQYAYEGNIYHLEDYTDEYEMRWKDDGGGFYLHGIHGGCHKAASFVVNGKLIGNRHENPELLEASK